MAWLPLTAREQKTLAAIEARLKRLKDYLNQADCPAMEAVPAVWQGHLAAIKEIVGNASNDMSFIACLSAKSYLCSTLPMVEYDAAAKPQGASGLDIDERTTDGGRVIGEIKTTTPFQQNDFGAAQISSFRNDFAKLNRTIAEHKFLFVTDKRAYDILKRKYLKQIPEVDVVLLTHEKKEITNAEISDDPSR